MAQFVYRHKHDFDGSCSDRGASAEESFEKILKFNNFSYRKANRSEQFRFWDFEVTDADGKKNKFEVKSEKKISRKDASPNSDYVWIEFKNVAGKDGWILGEADFIAFENGNNFIVVAREKLLDWVYKRCDLVTFVSKSKDALYKSYKRVSRPDEHLTIITKQNLLDLPHKIWQKQSRPANTYYLMATKVKGGDLTEIDVWDANFENIQKKRESYLGEYAEVVIKV